MFIAVTFVGGILLNLFDNLRGLGHSKLQAIFRELFIPGWRLFCNVHCNGVAKKSEHTLRFLRFFRSDVNPSRVIHRTCGPVTGEIGISFWSVLLGVLSFITTVIGAYVNIKDDL